MVIQRRSTFSIDKHRYPFIVLDTQFIIYFNSFSMVFDKRTAKFNSFHFGGTPSCF
jgi:hypothetical protein